MPRGGKRSHQPGRPKNQVSTKLVRLPENVDRDALLALKDDLSAIVGSWDALISEPKHKTSPRYEKAKQLLAEIKRLLSGITKDS